MPRAAKLLIALAVVGGGVAWFLLRPGDSAASKVRYRTAKVDRGEVVEGVAASGTVQPVELIQVGTQVSGVIRSLSADFNSKVSAKQPIALLDSRRLQAQVDQDEAGLARTKADKKRLEAAAEQAKADVVRQQAAVTQAASETQRTRAQLAQSQADVTRVEALWTQARAELVRQRQLVEKRLTSQSDLDAAVATEASLGAQRQSADSAVRQAEAQVGTSDAAVVQAKAQVEVSRSAAKAAEAQLLVADAEIAQAGAQLEGDRVNLEYATIVSPVDGVVVSRNVDVGQTVAASLQAPTLFVIARDLTKVQVQASVPEADIGRVKEKQSVTFSVDAYPERTFPGEVTQVRYASTTVSNVVTYTVIVDASNPETLLFPGMTANVTFEVARAKDSLRVPATALRLQPAPELLVAVPAKAGPPAAGGEPPPSGRGGGGRGRGEGGRTGGRRAQGTVYVAVAGNLLRPVAVRIGVSDGAVTAVEPVEEGQLAVDAEVVTAIVKEEEAATTSPLAPPRVGGGRGGRGGR